MNPWWYFIPFLLVPILVHLFDFRKTRKIYFSSVKFIANLSLKTKSQSRLKYYLILSNRFLLFITLLLLIAILTGKTSYGYEGSKLVGVHYDNSYSATLGRTDSKVEQALNQINDNVGSILYFDNADRMLIDKSTIVSVESKKTPYANSSSLIFSRFNESNLSLQYIFSDFQAFDSNELRVLMTDSAKEYHLILTNDLNKVKNLSIDSVYLLPNQDDLSELSILVSFNAYNIPSGSVVVKLMQGARQLSSIVKDVTELDIVRFDISKEFFGDFEVVIDGDDVVYDDIFHFTVGEKTKSKITIINSERSNVITQVFDNNELFNVEQQDLNNIDYQKLDDSDLVILSHLFELPAGLQSQLKDANFIIFPPDSIHTQSYEEFVGIGLDPNDNNITETSFNVNHPLLGGIFEKQFEDGSLPAAAALFDIEGDFESIIKYRGGNHFLLQKENIYFFNSSLRADAGGFQSSALFLPILYQIAFVSAGNLEIPYFYPGDRIVVNTKPSDVPVKLIGDNYEVIPPFNSSGSQLVLELPDDIEVGKYTLLQAQDTLRRVAINVAKEESAMNGPSLEDLVSAFEDMENVKISQIQSNESTVFAGNSQSSLWKYALLLAVILILTETVLHRYFR